MARRDLQLDTQAEDAATLPKLQVVAEAAYAATHLWKISRGTCRRGNSDGVEVIRFNNGKLRVDVLPTRGMGIWQATCEGLNARWESPISAPVHPQFVNLTARNGLGWLEGFGEFLCRCGLAHLGPPGIDQKAASPIESDLTLHGRIANLPAGNVQIFEDPETEVIGISGTMHESTLFGPNLQLRSTLSTRCGSTSFEIEDEITNRGGTPTELQLLYHINMGSPFLEAGAQLHCPARAMAPRDARAAEGITDHSTCGPPQAGFAEQVYFFEPLGGDDQRGLAVLTNADRSSSLCVRFELAQLPCFAFWKCTQDRQNGYVVGLEPGTCYPNFKTFEREQNRVRILEPGEAVTTRMQIQLLTGPERVAAVLDEVASIQQQAPLQKQREPGLPFCPAS